MIRNRPVVERYRMGLFRSVMAAAIFSAIARGEAGVSVTTFHNDNARTGQNLKETTLTPANVNINTFGLLFSNAVDGQIYGQPLYMPGVAITNKGTHNVVFVATEHDSVFALDADSNAAPLWKASFIDPAAGITTVPNADVDCINIEPEIGITSTPVIDPATMTLYVEAKTKEIKDGGANYYHRLHALNLGSGAERFGGPVLIHPVARGNGVGNNGVGEVPLSGRVQMNRAALLLANGVVYAAYASHCDHGNYHGWVLGFNATTLKPQGVFITTPNGGYGGVWEGGDGPAADDEGNIYVSTGNGTFDGNTKSDYADSYLKLTNNGTTLTLASYFTPCNEKALSSEDWDVGSGGLVVLPDEAGGAAHPHLAVGASKSGVIYLVDRDDLGGFNSLTNSQIVQSLTTALGYCFCTPAYFNNALYYIGQNDSIKAFTLSDGLLGTAPFAIGGTPFPGRGATPSISANGASNGIVWAVLDGTSAALYAYNATNVAQELYDSQQAGTRDALGAPVTFATPTVANGKVYVANGTSLAVFGGLVPTGLSAVMAGNQISMTWTNSHWNYTLQYTTNLTPPVVWSATGQAPAVSGSQSTVTIQIGPTNTFYRLGAAP